MHAKKFSSVIAGLVVTTSLTLAACSGDDTPDAASTASEAASSASAMASETASEAATASEYGEGVTESTKKASLSDWNGSFRGFNSYFGEDFVREAMDEAAEEHGETTDEMLAELEESRGADFEALVVDEDEITFVKSAMDLDNPGEEAVKYTFDKALDVKTDQHEFTWFIFKAEGDADHEYIALMPLHGEEALAHFHMRYGSSIEEILDPAMQGQSDDWYPTFVDPETATEDQIVESVVHHDH
ncbi:ZinT/AdcA family metal-binding protein [Corynebacterium sp. HMSC11E11]|uniref:ZinT/AdcA family metal-binding protein n=1 Tax=Corynebacterium sp. HMSC11E11 TaxID=1581089 RepID=UPI0008A32DF2|nr:ZinT/AdcA family metal-binding protein [Corynebacterium sp. HMSC11E11]OFU52321.1 hypothetical protein HMPREF3121_11295 [Corynebacterium sp. HMSC11E11]